MKRKAEKLDAAVCAEMLNWHKDQGDYLESKLQSKLSNGKPCLSGSPQLWEQYEMHRRFQGELEKLFSTSVREKTSRMVLATRRVHSSATLGDFCMQAASGSPRASVLPRFSSSAI